jgi:lincosamide nucleotidyltransferase A/C/D/E
VGSCGRALPRVAIANVRSAIAGLVQRDKRLHRWAGKAGALVAGASRWSPLRLLSPLRAAIRGEIRAVEVLRVVDALERAGVRSFLTGGWGVDAVLRHQTRRHDDLDLVIGDFAGQLTAACDALAPLGLRVASVERSEVLMPDRCLLEDGLGHRVDLVSVNWEVLAELAGWPPSVESRAGFIEEATVTGSVAGHPVPSLSPVVQAILRRDFERPLRRVDRHDLRLLDAKYSPGHRSVLLSSPATPAGARVVGPRPSPEPRGGASGDGRSGG